MTQLAYNGLKKAGSNIGLRFTNKTVCYRYARGWA